MRFTPARRRECKCHLRASRKSRVGLLIGPPQYPRAADMARRFIAGDLERLDRVQERKLVGRGILVITRPVADKPCETAGAHG